MSFPENIHKNYHAHLYFDKESIGEVRELVSIIQGKFGLKIGTIHDRLVGPHTRWSCQVVFSNEQFNSFIPWLDKNRRGLSVLVHAQTGDDYIDHTKNAYWLGDSVKININNFKR